MSAIRVRAGVAVAVATLAICAVALAAVKLKAHADLFYVKAGKFSISLVTKSSTRIGPGKPIPQVSASGILVVCPKVGGKISEVHTGFPGAKLKLSRGHYQFAITFTARRAAHVVLPSGPTSVVTAKVNVRGTVVGSEHISGTVSVTASGCSLPRSSYRTHLFPTS
jgi:hypothetical protein